MKKKIFYALLFIGFSIAIAYFLRYKLGTDFENKVPTSAEAIIHINTRQIEHHVLVDAVKNPSSYIDFKWSSLDKKKKSLLDGISIPKNTFLFTNSTNLDGFITSNTLEVKDHKDLSSFLKQEGFEESNINKVEFYKKGKIFFVKKNDELFLAYKYKKSDVPISSLASLFDEETFLSKKDALLSNLEDSGSDITLITHKNDFLELNFKNGELVMKGHLNSDFNMFLPHKTDPIDHNLVAYSSGKINTQALQSIASKTLKDKFKKLTSLSLDSITKKWDGDFTLRVNSIETKTDTIITYEYDDDFNQLEKKDIQKISNPDLDIKLKGDTLYDYLVSSKAIQSVEGDSLFIAIPLLQLYPKKDQSYIHLSSDKDRKIATGVENNSFLVSINIDKYVNNPLELFTFKKNKSLQLLKHLTARINQKNEISLEASLKNEKRNFISQLLKP